MHTPASSDARDQDFGSAADIVSKALEVGLSAIAVTDHNTVAWCSQMTAAARGTDLVVLPGFELSTPQGHLLGIWEEGTASSAIEDVLIRVGIEREHLGDLNVVATKSMSECAAEIAAKGGLAVAAHIDKEKGILTQPSPTYVNHLLADRKINAYEYVLRETPAKVAAKLGDTREPALIQSSDAYDATISRHSASGIGIRRTWIKAARPDLCGIRYALEDHELRVRLSDPAACAPHPTINSVAISAGFLGQTAFGFSPELNCLLGGTGAGKSLVLEALRFALDQQVDAELFKRIRHEVDQRLALALGDGTQVAIEISTHVGLFRIRRTFRALNGSEPIVQQDVAGEWVDVDRNPSSLITLAAFSQGEILEYARQPVGRMGLVDAKLDLEDVEARIAASTLRLRANGIELIASRDRVQSLTEDAAEAEALKSRERELSHLFDGDLVKAQGRWTAEKSALTGLVEEVEQLTFIPPPIPGPVAAKITPEHDDEFARILSARKAFADEVSSARLAIDKSLVNFQTTVRTVASELDAKFEVFKNRLDDALAESGASSLPLLRTELEGIQLRLNKAESAAQTLASDARPEQSRLNKERDELLTELKRARDDRRSLRRARADELNRKTSGFVKIDIPSRGDTTEFRNALEELKVGSRLREQVLDLIAGGIRPYNLVRAIWSGDPTLAGDLPEGVTATEISRLVAAVADRDLWQQLFQTQLIDTPDVLNVKFRKPEGKDYARIEDLSHGQKCTAILVILLADGDTPVLIDQPEDALHAPWIEEYLVDRLRDLRGSRQYILATRSPGLVVSADAEQLITMRATANSGEVEASGSLERYDLNKLALHHLEGGRGVSPVNGAILF
ncbi:AAA family ATPase [Rhodococcus sp. IEGM 1370]|uniref:AAA family ATPase n=1 Tax=Rhodococcus sp. IEGM 1370 TaxID=3082222 RepID=UPI0029544624|nr:AAA family ATPase [Rhodococcus sp. IEGM 1370]MDV8077417.1 AAA family ATPase [Rhodococcus sp. IEGM 1370]